MNSRTAVIIPVYNEASIIGKVVNDLLEIFPNVICINDGSTDNSRIEILKTNALLVEHPFNIGQGAALQTGIEFALQDRTVEYFITFDADGQHGIDDAEKMLKIIKTKKVDIVLGSRFKGRADNIPALKRYLLHAAIKFSNATSGLKLTDAHNGLRVFNRYVAETLNISMPDMAHGSEIIERISEMKYKYLEVPVTITYTEYSQSKGQSMINAVNIGFDMLLKKITK